MYQVIHDFIWCSMRIYFRKPESFHFFDTEIVKNITKLVLCLFFLFFSADLWKVSML